MMSASNEIIEGKYNYTKNKQIYCEENFCVRMTNDSRLKFIIESEVLSRSHTGEFLKVDVSYSLDSRFHPRKVEIKRSMGEKRSLETFEFDNTKHQLNYSFTVDEDTEQHISKPGAQPQVATPSFATSMLVTMAKRLNPTERTKYKMITSANIWNYETSPTEQDFYLKTVKSNQVKIQIGKSQVTATHCSISLSEDEDFKTKSQQIFLSKHFSIPYKGIFAEGIVIETEEMKIINDQFANIF